MGLIQQVKFDSWDKFKDYIKNHYTRYPAWVFRGQRNSMWEIESTLTRLANNVHLLPKVLEEHQKTLFRKRIRGLRGANPSPMNEDELWSLGQHHGLATPLIDWSESPFIAAYFAFEQKEKSETGYRSIYVLDKYGIEERASEKQITDFSFIEPLQDDNSRIIAQAGLFTKVPTGISFEAFLLKHELQFHLVELQIPDASRIEALSDLRVMNIQANTVYPDLHGAAISCNMWHENVSENFEQEEAKKIESTNAQ
ncbi:TPA: FRG domain-containing protein [Vibrio parahaemolyticus]|nr:FRG domain-containing protein [Vibrio parahaemolyticus]HBN6272077.1 FRG domain-containing protein [Vibrio parahaemolyticus]